MHRTRNEAQEKPILFVPCSSPISNVIGQFRSSVSEVVILCSRVVKLVSPVVCNSSPEGFLPEAKNLDVYGRSKVSVRIEIHGGK